MRSGWALAGQIAVVVIVTGVIGWFVLASWYVRAATDRRHGPRASIVPVKTRMIDTDNDDLLGFPDLDDYDVPDVDPRHITGHFAGVEAEERAAREAKRAQA